MSITNEECVHCGTQYQIQRSGTYDALDIPRELQDPQYCSDCKRAINEALSHIPRKFEYRSVWTDEITLDYLEEWEKLNGEDTRRKGGLFPIGMRVFASLSREGEHGWEHQVVHEVIGRGEFQGRVYKYTYWPSERSSCRITVERRFNLETNEAVGYRIKRV